MLVSGGVVDRGDDDCGVVDRVDVDSKSGDNDDSSWKDDESTTILFFSISTTALNIDFWVLLFTLLYTNGSDYQRPF